MVSFSCENCGDVLTKKKLDSHRNQCRGASYTCLDCMVYFQGLEYRAHTSCISEAQKYEGNLYKDKKNGKGQQSGNKSSSSEQQSQALVPRPAYVEDVCESTALAVVDAPPHAPSPPPQVNVFDFLIQNGGTTIQEEEDEVWESEDDMQLERVPDITAFLEHDSYSPDGFVYGSAPIKSSYDRYDSRPDLMPPPNEFVTPGNKGHSRNISLDSTGQKKSDKKRKRGHVEDLDLSKSMPSNGDVVMTDIPTVLHSGLTGGINRMLARPEFPPSPDLSGGDANGDGSPKSPIKRTRREKESSSRHDKEHRREKKIKRKSESDEGRKRSIPKSSRTREEPSSKRDKIASGGTNAGRWERRRSRKRSASPIVERTLSPQRHQTSSKPPALKAIEYPNNGPSNAEPTANNALVKVGSSALVEHNPTSQTVDTFLACLVKGSETDEGVSVWKALKRWRRDGGSTLGGGEKELWKGLKVRANEHGELVLCV